MHHGDGSADALVHHGDGSADAFSRKSCLDALKSQEISRGKNLRNMSAASGGTHIYPSLLSNYKASVPPVTIKFNLPHKFTVCVTVLP